MEDNDRYKTVAEFNAGVRDALGVVIEGHLQIVQSGVLGQPTADDLKFCGKLHHMLEELK